MKLIAIIASLMCIHPSVTASKGHTITKGAAAQKEGSDEAANNFRLLPSILLAAPLGE